MYYETTVCAVRKAIPVYVEPRESDLSREKVVVGYAHVLWLCKQIEDMNSTSLADALKASRLIGRILVHMETMGFWCNPRSEELIRKDCELGLDRPHQK